MKEAHSNTQGLEFKRVKLYLDLGRQTAYSWVILWCQHYTVLTI